MFYRSFNEINAGALSVRQLRNSTHKYSRIATQLRTLSVMQRLTGSRLVESKMRLVKEKREHRGGATVV